MFIDYYGELCALIGKSESAVAVESGIGKSTVSRWRNGSKPQDGSLRKLHDYFSKYTTISYDEIKNRANEKEPTDVSSFIEHLSSIEDQLTPEQKQWILGIADTCVRSQ